MRRAVHRPTPPLLTKAFIRVGPDPRDPKGRRSIYRGVGEDAGQVRRQIIPPRSRQRRQGQATPEPSGPVQETIEPQNQETIPMSESHRSQSDFHRPLEPRQVGQQPRGATAPARQVQAEERLWLGQGTTEDHALWHGQRHDPVAMLELNPTIARAVTRTASRQILAGMVGMLTGPELPELPPEVKAAMSVLQRACRGHVTHQELNEAQRRLSDAAYHYLQERQRQEIALAEAWNDGVGATETLRQAQHQVGVLRQARLAAHTARNLVVRATVWLETGRTLRRSEMWAMITDAASLHEGAIWLRQPAAIEYDEDDSEPERMAMEQRRLILARSWQLLRDVLGNPFDPVPASGVPINANVRVLAKAAYDDVNAQGHLDPARLAVLADALEEQGADERLVAALRPDGRPRPAGLWALRQVLEVNGERP